MKKRKIKLFASVASLAMVAAVMGVGVWAATSQTVSLTSTVAFAGTNYAGTITATVTGTDGATEAMTLNNNTASWTFTAEEAQQTKSQNIALDLDDATGDGLINAGTTLTYTFEIGTDTNQVAYTYTVTPAQENAAPFTIDTDASSADEGTITTAAANTVTLVFKLNGTANMTTVTGSMPTINLTVTQTETPLVTA